MAATIRTSACRVRVSPTRSNCLLLEEAQELRLGGRPELADLVEEERAALGRLDLPRLVPHRAGERPAGVAEELGDQQLLGEGGRS